MKILSKVHKVLKVHILAADATPRQIAFQFALVDLFSFCMLETFTALSSVLAMISITNSPPNTPKT